MGISSLSNRLRDIQVELDQYHAQIRVLLEEKDVLTKIAHKECKHKKVIYTDGHVHSDPDDYDTPEVRICLCCGFQESSEREYNQPYNFGRTKWHYKVLTATPIHRFCVPGRMMSDTVDYYTDMVDRQVKIRRANGEIIPSKKRDEMLETELSRYWEHVKDRIFRLSYPARVKAVMKIGYPA